MPAVASDAPGDSEQRAKSSTSKQAMDTFSTFRKTAAFRAHRRQIKLGPYLLLQTLGEGEFGKVKLAVHTQTGQEFAIKLIRKEAVGYSASRLNKVEREIHALKTLKHPYIVKLFNVVETEKYIGIILEYASGGELFEYILAHRSLKEKDARRLFAQLISSVHYMHRRNIVHRDLKLENLLLDRCRNIIVTDFGFANQFSSKEDDLMATSCGSPCYAAPELVVNDGLYAGSSVDIWSCGVILYAMLCGYLPFDDDPCNPDGNNISLLYRYILSNSPAFPKHISAEAQDLLSQMLVADPAKRVTLEKIEQHPWLKQYRSLFEKTDEELEAEAAVAAERSFTPSYRKPVWSSTGSNDQQAGSSHHCNDKNSKIELVSHAANDKEEEDDTAGISAPYGEEVKAENSNTKDEKIDAGAGAARARPATMHASTLRRGFTVGRAAADRIGIPTSLSRNRKARTAVIDNNECFAPPRSSVYPSPTESTPPALKPASKPTHRRRERLFSFFTEEPAAAAAAGVSDVKQSEESHVRKRCVSMAPPPTATQTTPLVTTLRQKDEHGEGLRNRNPIANPPLGASSPSKLRRKFMASLRIRRKGPEEKPVTATEIQDSIQTHRQESLKALTRGMNANSTTLGIKSGRRIAAEAMLLGSSKDDNKEIAAKPAAAEAVHGSGRTDRSHSPPAGNRHSLDPATLASMVTATDRPGSSCPPPSAPHQQQQKQQDYVKSKRGKMMAWIKRKSQGKNRRQSAEPTLSGNNNDSSNDDSRRIIKDMPPPPSPPIAAESNVAKPASHTMTGLSEMIDREQQVFESKLRVHHGAVDKTALTSKSPDQLFVQVLHTLCALGIIVKTEGDYKLKCVRPKAKVHRPRLPPSAPNMLTALADTGKNNVNEQDDDVDDDDYDSDAKTAPSFIASLFPDPGHLSDTSSVVQHQEEEEEDQEHEEEKEKEEPSMEEAAPAGSPSIPKSSTSLLSISSNSSQHHQQDQDEDAENMPHSYTEPIYGNPTIDTGEEIRFIVEICRFRNLPGLYILDIRRLKGNVWAYKFVYHKLLDLLNLGEGGGYLHRPAAGGGDTAAAVVRTSSPLFVKPSAPPAQATTFPLRDSAVCGMTSEQQKQHAPEMVSP